MRSERALINASRRLSVKPYLMGQTFSDTDHNHAFTAYWRMILGRHAPMVSYDPVSGYPIYEGLAKSRVQAREAIKRLRAEWYAKVS